LGVGGAVGVVGGGVGEAGLGDGAEGGHVLDLSWMCYGGGGTVCCCKGQREVSGEV
jgi:hypothetical protein